MACRCRVRVILYNTAVINALLRAQTGVTYNHPAGHIYMPVAIRKCNYLAYIYAFRSRRVKQGKGDPGGFKQFLRQENIKPGIIVRYVGNRFHVVFHLAGVLYYLRELFRYFMS